MNADIKIYIQTAPKCVGAVTPSSGSTLFVLITVTVVAIAGNTVVVWLHIYIYTVTPPPY